MHLRWSWGGWIAALFLIFGLGLSRAGAQTSGGELAPPFPLHKVRSAISSLWGDGADRLYASSDVELFSLTRQGRIKKLRLPGFAAGLRTELVGNGFDEHAILAVWNDSGQVVRVRDDKIVDASTLPRPVSVLLNAVDGSGIFYAADASGEMFVWALGQAAWRTVPPPSANVSWRGVSAGAGDGVYLLAADQSIYEFRDGSFKKIELQKGQLSEGAQRSAWIAIWASPATGALYVGAEPNYLLRFDLHDGSVGEERLKDNNRVIDEPLDFSQLRGVGKAVQSSESTDYVWLYSRKRGAVVFIFKKLDEDDQGLLGPVLPLGTSSRLFVDWPSGEWYVATSLRVEPLTLVTGRYFRDRPRKKFVPEMHFSPMPSLRLGMGTLFRLGRSPLPVEIDPPGAQTVAYTLDLSAGVVLDGEPAGRSPSKWSHLWLYPELGYRYGRTEPLPTHLGTVGLGIGGGSTSLYVLYQPRFAFGRALGETAIGFRHGVSMNILGGLSFDVTHQYLAFAGGGQHDVALMGAFDFGRLFYVLSFILFLRSAMR